MAIAIKKEVQDAFFNFPVKEIRHQHNTIIFVLNGGREVEISCGYDERDEITHLDVDLYVTKRERVGGYEV